MDTTITMKKRLAPPTDAAATSTNKRPRHAAGGEEEEEEEDDMAFLARLQQQAEQEEAEISKAARLRSTMSNLRQEQQQQIEDSEEEEEDEDERQQSMTTPFPRPQTDDDDLSAGLERALELNDWEISHRLLEYDPELMLARINEELEQPLAVAINARFARGIKFLLHKNCPLLEVDGQGWSALHLAVEAFEEMPFLLRYLLQYRGLDINARAPLDKVSPLSLASDERALKLLLASGADPSQPVSAAAGGSGKEEEEETLLQRIERTWPKGKKKKKARFMLTTLAPYQSYMLSKLCLLAEVYRYKEPPPSSTTTTTTHKPQQSGAAAAASASASLSSPRSILEALTQTARSMLIDTRLETNTRLINIWKSEDDEGDEGGGEGEIMCKEEVPGKGIFSFVQDGKVFIARSRSTSPNYTHNIPPFHTKGGGGGGGGGGGAGGASSSSSATSSPLTAPLEDKGDYTQTYTQAQGNPNPHPHPAPSSPTLCPLSVLKEANVDFFLVGDADAEQKGDGQNEKEGEGKEREEEGEGSKGCGEEEWELLPALPRVEIHYTQTQAQADYQDATISDPAALAAAVLHHLVVEGRNDSVLDALHGFLWMGGGRNGNRRSS